MTSRKKWRNRISNLMMMMILDKIKLDIWLSQWTL